MSIKDYIFGEVSPTAEAIQPTILSPNAPSIENYLFNSGTATQEYACPPILEPEQRPSIESYLFGTGDEFASYPVIPTPILEAQEQPNIEDYLFGSTGTIPAPIAWGNVTGEANRIIISGQPAGAVLGAGVGIALDTKVMPATSVVDIGKYLQLSSSGTNVYSEVISGIEWGVITGEIENQSDLQSALDAKEDSLGNPSVDGQVLSSTIAGVRSWITVEAPSVYTEVTVTELSNLISTSGLTPQAWYLITDYQTKDYIRQTLNPVEFYTGAVEQIFVQASSTNTLYYDGMSATYTGELIGYLHSRGNFYENPSIYYDGSNYEPVEITILDETHFELTTNPFPSNPDNESDFQVYIYDNDTGGNHTFTSSDKGINWEFDENGYFHLLNSFLPQPVYYYSQYSWEDGNLGDTYLDILTSTTLGISSPVTDFSTYNIDNSYLRYYSTDGWETYFDAGNYGWCWTINASNEFEITDRGKVESRFGYMYEYVNGGDYDIIIDSATEMSLDVSNFTYIRGCYNIGTTNIYISWNDSTYVEFDFSRYGTNWTIDNNKIKLLGETHSLLTDAVEISVVFVGTDQTYVLDLTGETLLEGDSYFDEPYEINLNDTLEISGSWTYLALEDRPLIVNRRNQLYDIDIDFDFRATKFRRYRVQAETYVSGVYDQGAVVNYGQQVFIKTWSEGTVRAPSGGQYYISWAYVCPNALYYVIGINSIVFNGLTISPNLAEYSDSCMRQYLGLNFNFDLSTIRGIKIKFPYGERTIGSCPDIVLMGTNHYSSTIELTQNTCATIANTQDCDVKLDYTVIISTNFNKTKGLITNFVGNNLSQCEISNMNSSLWYNLTKSKLFGTVTNFICGAITESYGNLVASSLSNSRVGWYIKETTINNFSETTVNMDVRNNFINSIKSTTVGQYMRYNQIYSECYGASLTQYMENNRIYGQFGYALASPAQNAGKFLFLSGNDLYAYFYEATNSNIGGTTKYNDFNYISNCVIKGNVNGNNLPYTYFNNNNVMQGMSNVDKIGSNYDTISYNDFNGTFYNVRFTGNTTLSYNKFFTNFQNGWFGGGTFASPTNNGSGRNFVSNNCYGYFQQFQHETGYVRRNIWLGNCEAWSSTWTKFNHGNGVDVADNTFGVLNKGNQFLRQMIGCTIGANAGDNTFNGNMNQVTIGTNFVSNTVSVILTACEIGNSVSSTTIPSMSSGVRYPKLLLKGAYDGGSTMNIFDVKNLTDLQLFLCNNAGQFSIGNTEAQGQLTVYRNTATPGTITNTAGSTSVSGIRTVFKNTFKVGDSLTVGGQTVTVTSIPYDFSLTVTPAITNANTNATYTTTAIPVLVAYAHGKVGIGRINPVRALDINDVAGECLRLVYNDDNGEATNYVDFAVSSSGDLTVTATGGDIITTNILQTGGYKSSDGTAGITDTFQVTDGTNTYTLTFKNGLLVGRV